MIDANRGCSVENLQRLKEASYERFRVEFVGAVEMLLEGFEMDWDDLANKLAWPDEVGMYLNGSEVKRDIGTGLLSAKKMNDIAHVFSMEPYIIFRPRFPFTQN